MQHGALFLDGNAWSDVTIAIKLGTYRKITPKTKSRTAMGAEPDVHILKAECSWPAAFLR